MKFLVVITCISLLSVVKSQENISWNGTASQSSTHNWGGINLKADLAITGGPTHNFSSVSCATTLPTPIQYTVWWMLTFPVDTVYITTVRIYYRDITPNRLAGYSLYISNSSTTKTGGYLCYHHEGPELPNVLQNINCNHLGQYVIIYNERNETSDLNPPGYSDGAILELCEVEIYGCYKGWWDRDCTKSCPVNCISGHCYSGNGSCVWGCNPDNCLNDRCDTVTGVCTDGCKIGLDGDSCDRACDSGKFGNNCRETCHCINQPCDPIAATCPTGGCKRGYTSINCSTACSLGYYGYNCNQSCDGCLSDSCDKEYGVCTDTSRCEPGRQPGQPKCDIACESGQFGNRCSGTCHCINQPCNLIHGMCPSGGCTRGYNGMTCTTACSLGYYGYNCNQSCDGCLSDSCDKEYGVCTDTSRCEPGRQPGQPKCDIACESGQFGNRCSGTCHCINQPCNLIHGMCPSGGCTRGYNGMTCTTECSLGYHGYKCNQSCDGCLSDSCDREYGFCTDTSGCKPGWQPGEPKCDLDCNTGTYGVNCKARCDTCVNRLCDRFDGKCRYGCIAGFEGDRCHLAAMSQSATSYTAVYTGVGSFVVTALMCVIIVLATLRYRRNKKERSTKQQNEDKTRRFENDAFTNDYSNIGVNSTEAHYVETIPATLEQPCDTI